MYVFRHLRHGLRALLDPFTNALFSASGEGATEQYLRSHISEMRKMMIEIFFTDLVLCVYYRIPECFGHVIRQLRDNHSRTSPKVAFCTFRGM